MTRRDTPTRHGRAADALIASYVRELLAEDEVDAVSAAGPAAPAEQLPASIDASAARAVAADATL